MKPKLILFVVAYIVWALLSWVPDWQHLAAGVAAAALVAWLTGDLFVAGPRRSRRPARCWYFIFWYLPVLAWECLKANLDVAWRVSHPKLPINPGIVKVRTGLKSDTGLTFLANSITLTPGTLSVDIDRDDGFLYVHWIDVKGTDIETATRVIVERFERILRKVFE